MRPATMVYLVAACLATACGSAASPAAAGAGDGAISAGEVAAADALGDAVADASNAPDLASETASLADADAVAKVDQAAGDAQADTGPQLDGAADALADTPIADAGLPDAAADAAKETGADAVKPIGDCLINMEDSSPSSVPWTLFAVTKGAGPCPPNAVCQWSWAVAVDGAISKSQAGVVSAAQMTPQDLQTLGSLVGNGAFFEAMKNGWKCDPPPTDIGISFSLALSGVKYGQDVTGCVLSAKSCNWAKAAYEMVAKY